MPEITEWDVENDQFWERYGQHQARKNLWLSAFNLMCGFAVWLSWSIITVLMLNTGYPFSAPQLFSLIAVAGLSSAALRIPSGVFIRLVGGRNAICFTSSLLILPAIGIGLALESKQTPFWVFQLLAVLSGVGGGNFASTVSNVGTFFPRKHQWFSISLTIGLGSLGISVMQIMVPLVTLVAIFGGNPMLLQGFSGNIMGRSMPGTEMYIFNAGYVWLLFLIPMVLVSWFSMSNIRTPNVSPRIHHRTYTYSIILVMMAIAFASTALGVWLLPLDSNGFGFSKETVLIIVIVSTVCLLRLLPGEIRAQLNHEYQIFGNKHTWATSIIYTMTFGTFIGFAAAFPLLIKVVFGYSHVIAPDGTMTHNTLNNYGPNSLMYVWLGPLIGVLTRPLGRWAANTSGGARVTECAALVMIVSVLVMAHYLKLSYQSETPEQFFIPFFLAFLILFVCTGIGYSSSLHTISNLFNSKQMSSTLSWISAIATFGAFYIPMSLAEQFETGSPEKALYGFAVFYLLCIMINSWFYLRKKSERYNP